MSTKVLAFVIAGGVGAYLVLTALRAWSLIATGDPVPMGLGFAVIVIPIVGAWLLYGEIAFGLRTQRLGRELGDQSGLPVDDLPHTPSGRIDREAADARFVEYQRDVEEDPADWRRWYRLAIGYDDARDRKRARSAMREAIRLHG